MSPDEINAISEEYARIVPGFRFLPDPRAETPWLREALDGIYKRTKLRPVGKPLATLAWEIEKRLILAKNWQTKYQWNEAQHMLRLACILWPSLISDPWLQAKFWAVVYTRDHGKKFCNFFGCASSGKSEFSGLYSLLLLALNKNNKILITGPWEKTRDESIWKQSIVGGVKELIQHWGRRMEPHWDISIRESECDINFGGQGSVACRASDKHGKLQGGKQERDRFDKNEGGSITLVLEEAAKWQNTAILRDFSNLVSNPSFICITNCNPENTVSGLDAELGAPLNREFASLNPDEDMMWSTRRSGFVFRFDGLRSPRVLGWEKLCHPQLFGKETIEAISETSGGIESDGFWAMVRSFPRGTIGGRLVTDETRQQAAGCFDKPSWAPSPKTHVLFLDCAFGGHDPATWVLVCCGDRRDAAGTVINTVAGVEIGVLPINSSLIATAETEAELKSLGWLDVEAGKPIFPGLQCAWQLRKKIDEWKRAGIEIIPRFVGYDQSLRGEELSLPMRILIGPEVFGLDPTSKPSYDKPVLPIRKSPQPRAAGQTTNMFWSEFCSQKVTEVWLVSAYILHSGAVRDGLKILSGLKAMATRFILKKQSRTDVTPKKDWKEQAKTAYDAADALCGALFLAYSRGLVKYTHTPENMKPIANSRSLTITPALQKQSEWRQKRESAHLIY